VDAEFETGAWLASASPASAMLQPKTKAIQRQSSEWQIVG
jgi:hypothetical protein